VEETMFRGVLYRHLREATAGRSRWRSVVISALVAAFIFAALHSQGLLGILPLMALACGFTAAREWRASLVPSMTVHALHNGMLTMMLILAAG
jgi:membrane protease YdiL (CAAX protease family)